MSASDADPGQHVSFTAQGTLKIRTPVASVPFRPHSAYKALAKMGVALLPNDELDNYKKLRAWLLDVEDALEFPYLDVGMSFTSLGNAPALATGTLLRRINPADNVPHILFVFSAGSVCFQIDLMSDYLEDHIPPVPSGAINIEWSNVIFDPNSSAEIRLDYGKPVHLNWSSNKSEPQPVKEMVLHFNPQTLAGSLTPIFR
jgi:hypothetical protein